MPKLIPERPLYRRERLIVGYAVLAVFVLLFLSHFLYDLLSIPSDAILPKLLPMAVALLAPTLIFWMVRGPGYTRVLRLRTPRATHIPFLIAAFFAILSGCLLLSILCGGTETLGNNSTSFESISFETPLDAILMTVALAILPALLEELFFRGILIAEYERRGSIRAVCMSALLFGLCHFDLRNLPVYLFSGIFFALVVFATDSLVAAAILHILYNTVSLFGQRYLNAFYEITGGVELFLFVLILMLLIALTVFFKTGARIYRLKEQSGRDDPRRDVPWNVQFYTILDALIDPPILICIVLTIVGFIVL